VRQFEEADMTIRQIALTTALAMSMAGLVVVDGAAEADQKLQMKDLPAAVQTGVTANLIGGTLKGLSKEVEGDKTIYEVETTLNGRTRDFLLDATGRLIELEDEMAMDVVPAAVKAALEAHGKIVKIESVTRGKVVTYEGTVEKGGKKSEVAVDANGKKVKG
jgi:uncharacterized membrane protein YkoI